VQIKQLEISRTVALRSKDQSLPVENKLFLLKKKISG
jgi:hypothetical protein